MAAAVIAFMGGEGDEPQIEATLPLVTTFVKAYVRGVGFNEIGEPNDDLWAVIVSATARLAENPTLDRQRSVDDFRQSPGSLASFSLVEQAVLHLYRRRTA